MQPVTPVLLQVSASHVRPRPLAAPMTITTSLSTPVQLALSVRPLSLTLLVDELV